MTVMYRYSIKLYAAAHRFFNVIKAFIFLSLLFPCFFCYSQNPSEDLKTKFLIKKLSLKGLPDDSYFSSVQQDDDGFLWIGTLSGLFRYDGFKVLHFLHDPSDSNSLGNNYAATLSKDRKGNLWIGTFGSGFINVYDRDSGTIKRVEPAINNTIRETIRKVKNSLNDKTIIAATTRCMYKVNPDGNTLDSILLPQPHASIADFIEYENDKFVVAASSTILILDWKQRKISELSFPSSSGKNFRCLETDAAGNLLAGSNSGILLVNLNDSVASYNDLFNQAALRKSEIDIIKRDPAGRLWVGTNAGMFLINGGEIQKINDAVNITDIFINSQGIAWVTTEDNGLYQFSQPGILFNTIPAMEKYSQKSKIQSILEEKLGVWLIGTMFGLYRYYFSTGKFEKVKLENDKEDNKISYLFKDKNGGIWVGTADEGIFHKEASQEKYLNFRNKSGDENSIPADFIASVTEDEYNNIWIGTFSGGRDVKSLCLYDPRIKKIKPVSGNIADNKTYNASAISQIATDYTHNLWVGTLDMGLFRYRLTGSTPAQNTFTNYSDSSSGSHKISHSVVCCVTPGRNGIIWFGTLSGGLNVFDTGKDSVYWLTMKDGLPSNLIYRIEEDDQGIIWMSTDHGITRYDPVTRSCINYNTTSGLPSNNFTFFASMKSPDGTIAFGTNDGQVVYFNPNSYKNSVNTQSPVITDILLFNKSLETGSSSMLKKAAYLTDTLKLNYDQSVISFEFSNMDFLNPEIFTYAYKLIGFDKDWTYITDRNLITYTNLDPGTYTLLVKQSNHLGIWNEQPKTLTLIITPPFWKTWWFYLLSVLAGCLAIFLLLQGYVKRKLKKQLDLFEKQKAIESERIRISSELHDDIGGELSAIHLLSEMNISSVDWRQQLSRISVSSSSLIQKMNEIVWSLNSSNDSLQSLVAYIRSYAGKYLDDVNIDLSFSQPDKIPDVELSGANRRNILLVVKEALNNVIKHSNARRVEISVIAGNSLIISIHDNGRGITPDIFNNPNGNGLKNMRNRIKEMKGSIEIRSVDGTSLIFTIPISGNNTKG
jgi:signal transduction histidine kinase/ligand-binding sensor domain-containing protein